MAGVGGMARRFNHVVGGVVSRDKVGRTLDERSIKTHSWEGVGVRVVVRAGGRTSWSDHGGATTRR